MHKCENFLLLFEINVRNVKRKETTTTRVIIIFLCAMFSTCFIYIIIRKNNRNDGMPALLLLLYVTLTHARMNLFALNRNSLYVSPFYHFPSFETLASHFSQHALFRSRRYIHTHKNVYAVNRIWVSYKPIVTVGAKPSLRISMLSYALDFSKHLSFVLARRMYLHSESFAQLMNSSHTHTHIQPCKYT